MQLINGWTKEKVLSHLEVEFAGKSSLIDPVLQEEMSWYHLDDKKCIVGCFIPDSEYLVSIEGKNAHDIIIDAGYQKLMPLSPNEMARWQRVHDRLDAKQPVYKQIQQLMDFIK